MTGVLVAGCWIVLFLFLLTRLPFFRHKGLHVSEAHPLNWVAAAFLYQVFAGFANYYIWLRIIGHGDSIWYFHDSTLVYSTLFQHPADFCRLTFGYFHTHFPASLAYISDQLHYSPTRPEYNMVRLNALLDVVSFGSPWGNIVLLAFLQLAVLLSLFGLLCRNYVSASPKLLFLVLFFLPPSISFWTGGLLKEGPTLVLLSILVIQLMELEKRFTLLRVAYVCLCLVLFSLIRDYVLLLVEPNLLLWLVARSNAGLRRHPWKVFLVGTGIFILLLLLLPLLNPDLSFPGLLQQQQQYFLAGGADPDYAFHILQGSNADLLLHVPYMLNNAFLRPNILHSSSLFRAYASLELLLTWAFLAWGLWKRNIKIRLSATLIFLLINAIELLCMYGYVVTDADSMSRYRTVPLAFILLIAALIRKPGGILKSGNAS